MREDGDQKEGFGLVFPSGSVEGLAEKIRLLMDDDTKREALGKRGREFAGRYLWDRIAKEFEGVLNSTRQIS
jgi:glycosyltransferase involved in cell wall biosynthesis